MAFSNGLNSSRDESSYQTFAPPIRTSSSQHINQLASTSTDRLSLNRRFTTNAITTLPTLSSIQSPLFPIAPQRRQVADHHDFGTTHEQQHQRELAEQLKLGSLRARQEADRLEQQYRRLTSPDANHASSEPTTPPELQESSLASIAFTARSKRFSVGITSPLQPSTNSFHRSSFSGSQHSLGLFNYPVSKPASGHVRRQSEDEVDDDHTLSRASATRRVAVRNSMPVTNFEYRGMSPLPDVGDVLGIGSLLDDDDDYRLPLHRHTTSIDRPGTLYDDQVNKKFLFPYQSQGESSVSGITSSLLSGKEFVSPSSGGWPSYPRHRQGQQSLPLNSLRAAEEDTATPSHSRNSSIFDLSIRAQNNNCHSMDINYNIPGQHSNRSSIHVSPSSNNAPSLRPSLSSNDVPTVSSLCLPDNPVNSTGSMTHEQRLHNHNATLGRIPANAGGHRREPSMGDRRSFPFQSNGSTASSVLNIGAIASSSVGIYPSVYAPASTANSTPNTYTTSYIAPSPGLTNISGMQYSNMIGSNMSGPHVSRATSYATAAPPYGGTTATSTTYGVSQPNSQAQSPQAPWSGPSAAPYSNYPHFYYQQQYHSMAAPRRDSQQRVIAQRRGQKNDDSARGDNRFSGTSIEDHLGKIFEVSKDQNGCRYLQKKIEEDQAKNLPVIFNETKDHVVELMKDPFGNYLCQKLLENCDSLQRTTLIHNAAPCMVEVAINQHGTRALQKMIEYVASPEDVEIIVKALSARVVTLIQDLNGNHVVQKCLNHLRPEDAQFIFDAVGLHALTVGSHRHGCCVLQRCIDHASGKQKDKLVSEITQRAYTLMQDAYGNYVIQYILDLNDVSYTGPLCVCFKGHVVELSCQKFSSNVIEKSIRMADIPHQREMIQELYIESSELEKLLRDNYANYVVQTALEHGPPDMQDRLWELIRPILGNIRATPCGRRLAQKLAQREGSRSGQTSGSMTPKEGVLPTSNEIGVSHAGIPYGNQLIVPSSTHNLGGVESHNNHVMGGARVYNLNANGNPSNMNPVAKYGSSAGNTPQGELGQVRGGSFVQLTNGFF